MEKTEVKRKFTGKLDNFESKEQKHYNDRMLRAYLKGATSFNYGFTGIWPNLFPKEHNVLQSYR